MAVSPYASTEETTNACRASRLLLGPCTDELRDVLRHFVPPSTFPNLIKQKLSNLPRLTAPQMNLILPRGSTYTGNYGDMDISLLYALLRNICYIKPHSKGWGKDPHHTDRSLSANIDRIRIARNQCVHSTIPVLSNADFITIWTTIHSAVVDLDSFLNNGNRYEREVDFLRNETMDPVRDLHYLEELRKQAERDEATKELYQTLKRKLEVNEENLIENQKKMKESFENIEKQMNMVPQHVTEKLTKWEEEDLDFQRTHNFEAMFNKVNDGKRSFMTFVGIPGSGKSATIHHIALKLKKDKQYKVIPLADIWRIKDYSDNPSPQVFVIDDVIGVLGLENDKLRDLKRNEKHISEPFNKSTKILMSCRESKYGLGTHLLHHTLLKKTSDMFPLLCKIYSKMKLRPDVTSFFTRPVKCILDELDKMQDDDTSRLSYATLVLCMLNNKKLSKEILKDRENNVFNEMKSNVLELCEVQSCTDAFKFLNALSAMEGTYTKLCDTEYTFVHDSLFEIIACHFGKQFPGLFLQYINSSYIANKVKVREMMSESSQEDLYVILPEDQYSVLAERLYRDLKKIKLDDVFMHNLLKQPKLCQVFIELLKGETKSYADFASLFLLDQTDESIIRETVLSVIWKSEDWVSNSREFYKQSVLVNGGQYGENRVRVISWVIYFGHHQILSYILKEIYPARIQSDLFRCRFDRVLTPKIIQREKNKYIPEQYRLLLLSCYSCDLKTVQILLKYVDKNIVNLAQNVTGDLMTYTWKEYLWHDTPLTAACRNGHVDIVKELINFKADVNLQGEIDTPLIAACESGHLDVVKELLKHNASVNLKGKYITPLTAACKGGYYDEVDVLLKREANVNPQDEDTTPLVAACTGGHLKIVRKLLEANANINVKCRFQTPLEAACFGGHINVVTELVQKTSEINPDGTNNTPLIVACQGGHLGVVEVLLKEGAYVNPEGKCTTPLIEACEGGYVDVVNTLLKANADVNQQGRYNAPLKAACRDGNIDIVKALLEKMADVNPQNLDNTPLTEACFWGHTIIVKELIKAKSKVNIQCKGDTPLMQACRGGHSNIVQELINAGVDVNMHCKDDTPLTAACKNGNLNVVQILINAMADVNLQAERYTPLTQACAHGKLCIVKELIKADADVNLQDKYETPLTMICSHEDLSDEEENYLIDDEDPYEPGNEISIIRELIKAKADVNLKSRSNTPLIEACAHGNIDIVKELLKAEANVNLQSDGFTPLIKACYNGHESLVRELLYAGADVNLHTEKNISPLTATWSAADEEEEWHEDVAKLLIEAGADLNLKVGDDAPLIKACTYGDPSIVGYLLKAGAVINHQDIIQSRFREDILQVLQEAGANIDSVLY